MQLKLSRIEVMHFLAQKIDEIIDQFLKNIWRIKNARLNEFWKNLYFLVQNLGNIFESALKGP